MSGQSRSARSVFVGNIPYDATEEQLIEIFQEVGQVVSFRLVFDRDTGKPKGYGFCEYRDSETALSAIRNLNNYDFSGRNLRVDFADQEKQQMQKELLASQQASMNAMKNVQSIKPVPPTAPSNMETVSNFLIENMSQGQMYDIVAKMKALIQQNPEQGRQILLSNPQMAYALLQAQLMLGMINVQTVQKILATRSTSTTLPTVPPPSTSNPPNLPSAPDLHPKMPILPTPGIPPMGMPPFGIPTPISNPYPPPVKGQFVPPPAIPPSMHPQQAFDLQEQQKILFQQLMSLGPDQIEKLPPEQRQQIQQLRQLLNMRY